MTTTKNQPVKAISVHKKIDMKKSTAIGAVLLQNFRFNYIDHFLSLKRSLTTSSLLPGTCL